MILLRDYTTNPTLTSRFTPGVNAAGPLAEQIGSRKIWARRGLYFYQRSGASTESKQQFQRVTREVSMSQERSENRLTLARHTFTPLGELRVLSPPEYLARCTLQADDCGIDTRRQDKLHDPVRPQHEEICDVTAQPAGQ